MRTPFENNVAMAKPLTSWPSWVIVVLLCFSIGTGHTDTQYTKECVYYDPVYCDANPGDTKCNSTTSEVCVRPDPDKRAHCFASWKNSSSGIELVKMGCWLNDNSCYDQKECVEKNESPNSNIFFCCCDGDNCNQNFNYDPVPTPPLGPGMVEKAQPDPPMSPIFSTLMYSLVPITGIAFIIAVVFWMWRRHKMAYHEQLPTQDPTPLPPDSPLVGLRPLQLLEIKARGRFGCVWKANMVNETVAVKIFPLQDRHSWMAEKDIYNLPHMNHENILRYIGSERRGDSVNMELWLISEFHERGSLYDYLKGNLITWTELCKIAHSMATGIAYLHVDFTGPKGHKPATAHRDFKSRNVLIKQDLTACIADFGLALKFEPGQSPGDTHGQVGTRRYMAPEVLEGAINFNRDAFLRIDMYACGLVLWELVSRCSAADGPVEEYQLPFEDLPGVGSHPSLEDMQEAVVRKKLRPLFKEHWYNHTGLAALCETIEECWDHDAEARVTAGCIAERLSHLCKTTTTSISIPNVVVTSNYETPAKESSI